MFIKPGIKSLEGLKTSGIYGLVIALIINPLFPDLTIDQAFESSRQIAQHLHDSLPTVKEAIHTITSEVTGIYLLFSRLKKGNDDAT